MLGFARRPSMENALGFSFGFTTFGELTVVFGGLAAELKPPFQTRQLWLDSAVMIGGHDRRSKPSFIPD